MKQLSSKNDAPFRTLSGLILGHNVISFGSNCILSRLLSYSWFLVSNIKIMYLSKYSLIIFYMKKRKKNLVITQLLHCNWLISDNTGRQEPLLARYITLSIQYIIPFLHALMLVTGSNIIIFLFPFLRFSLHQLLDQQRPNYTL